MQRRDSGSADIGDADVTAVAERLNQVREIVAQAIEPFLAAVARPARPTATPTQA